MRDPIDITFAALGRLRPSEVEGALLATLDRPDVDIRTRSIELLVKAAAPGPLTQLIERYPDLTDAERARLLTPTRSLYRTLDHCLRSGSPRARAGAIEAVTEGGVTELLPAVVELAASRTGDRDRFLPTMLSLVDAVADERTLDRPGPSSPNATRRDSITALAAAARAVGPRDAGPFLRSLFVLTRGGDRVAAEFLARSAGDLRDVAFGILADESHPHVISFLLDLLRHGYLQPRVLDIFRMRRDIGFVAAWLRSFGRERSTSDVGVLREVGQVGWLTDDLALIDRLPDDAQAIVVSFADAVGLSESATRALRYHLLRNGSASARAAVADDFQLLGREESRDILLEAITTPEDEVAVWAVGELHRRNLPDAGGVLLELLDGDRPVLRDAAREILSGFDLEKLLELRERLPVDALRRAVALGRKIDPELTVKLHARLTSGRRRERVRAAGALGPMGVTDEMLKALRQLLAEDDTGLRRAAVDALAWGRAAEARDMLELAARDRSPLVATAAVEILEKISPAAVPAEVVR